MTDVELDKLVAAILPEITDEIIGPLTDAVAEALERRGYEVIRAD